MNNQDAILKHFTIISVIVPFLNKLIPIGNQQALRAGEHLSALQR